MKETWLYKKLHEVQYNSFASDFHSKTTTGASLINIIIIPMFGIVALLTPFLFILTFFLGIFKDLYDLYYYLNAEKIAKKEAIKKALELNNKIKKYIDNYQSLLDKKTTYMLQKITYEEKPKVELLPGVNCGYLGGGINQNELYLGMPSRYRELSRQYNHRDYIVKKELLTKEIIHSRHSTFIYFIIQFFKTYNNECDTISSVNYLNVICNTNRRRSLHDIYLITKYYYPEVTFIDIIKTIIFLLKNKTINGSYCSTVQKYVFYTNDMSDHNNFNSVLEFTNEITFNDLKKYIENEQ